MKKLIISNFRLILLVGWLAALVAAQGPEDQPSRVTGEFNYKSAIVPKYFSKGATAALFCVSDSLTGTSASWVPKQAQIGDRRLFTSFALLTLVALVLIASTPAFSRTGETLVRQQASGLVATQWFWTKLAPPGGAIDIDTPSNYTLDFRSDGSLLIKADCNRAAGSFTVDGAKLSIKLGPTTLAACPGGSRGEELLQLLGKTERFAIAGEMLILILNNETSLAFNPPSIVDRCGEKAILPNTIADTLEPSMSSALDKGLAGFIVAGLQSSPGASMLVITPKGRYFKSAGVADVATCSP